MNEASESKQSDINRVAFRVPDFIYEDPELYFAQCESQFILSGITADSTKFHAVIANLDSKILTAVKDLILNPPAKDAYETLKKSILDHFAKSTTSKLRQLISEMQLGDMKPSALLISMKSLAPGRIDEELLKTLWMQKLPINLQQILSVSKDNLQDLAQIADKIHETSFFAVSAIKPEQSSSDIEQLKIQIQALTEEVRSLKAAQHRRPNTYRRMRSRSRDRSGSGRQNGLCYYHWRFKDQAQKCVQPCRYSLNSNDRQ